MADGHKGANKGKQGPGPHRPRHAAYARSPLAHEGATNLLHDGAPNRFYHDRTCSDPILATDLVQKIRKVSRSALFAPQTSIQLAWTTTQKIHSEGQLAIPLNT